METCIGCIVRVDNEITIETPYYFYGGSNRPGIRVFHDIVFILSPN